MSKRRCRNKVPSGLSQAEVKALAHEGRGIARVNGKTTFIENALPGEIVEFRYISTRTKFDEGITENVIEASAQRVTPACDYFGYCGGCSMQHMSAKAQLTHKQNVLLEQLEHIGKVEPENVLAPLTGPLWGYRHKARLAVKYVTKKGKVMVGFREQRSTFVADIEGCEVLHPAVGKKLTLLRALVYSLTNFNHIPQIEVAVAEDATALVIRHIIPFTAADLETLKRFEQEQNFRLYLQPSGYDSVHSLRNRKDTALTYSLPDYHVTLEFLPTDFMQINPSINRSMVALALELLEPGKDDHILDLFCGVGNFTLPIATYAGQITGVEGDAGLIERAKTNAKRNHINNVDFQVANLADEYMAYPFMQKSYNKLLLDPPRTGAREIILALNLEDIKRIVYVSCNPATLARDAGILVSAKGYRLIQAGVIDMFPHTSHVESVALFLQ